MSDRYLIVKVEDADEEWPSKPLVEGGKVIIPKTNMGRIRGELHDSAEKHFISIADFPTGLATTPEEDKVIEKIFDDVLKRARKGYRRDRYEG